MHAEVAQFEHDTPLLALPRLCLSRSRRTQRGLPRTRADPAQGFSVASPTTPRMLSHRRDETNTADVLDESLLAKPGGRGTASC